jgi:hypothetical protein
LYRDARDVLFNKLAVGHFRSGGKFATQGIRDRAFDFSSGYAADRSFLGAAIKQR